MRAAAGPWSKAQAQSALFVLVFDFDDLKGGGVDFRLETMALPVSAVDFVTAIVDLDALQPPAAILSHGAHGLAWLPRGNRTVAIVPCLGGCGSEQGKGNCWQEDGLHNLFLGSLEQ